MDEQPISGGCVFPLQLPLRELLSDDALASARVVLCADGLDRQVAGVDRLVDPDAVAGPRSGLVMVDCDATGLARYLERSLGDRAPAAVAAAATSIEGLSPEMINRCQGAGLPLVSLPDEVDQADLVKRLVAHRLELQAFRLARSEQLHHDLLEVVLRQEGLDQICATLASSIGAPTLVTSLDGRLLTSAGLESLGLEGADRAITVDDHRVQIGDRTFKHVSVPIAAGPRLHGSIVAVLSDGEDLVVDPLMLRNASTVAALVIAKDLEVRAVEDKYRTDLMHDLLSHVDDPADSIRRARSFGWDIERRLIVLVVRFDDAPEVVVPDEVTRRPALANALRQVIMTRDQSAAVVEFNREVVVLTAAFDGPRGRLEAGAFARRLVDQVSRHLSATVSAGQSRPVQSIEDIRTGYVQATAALQVGREIYGRGTVQHFLDLGAYRLLSQVENKVELEVFAQEVLGALIDDGLEPGSMLETLQVLLEENCNFAAAARRLHFHYNTLRHRAVRLEQEVGPFLHDHRVRLDVQVALLILGMKGLHLRDLPQI